MRRTLVGLLILSSLFITPYSLIAQSSYSLKVDREAVILGAGLALSIVDYELIKAMDPLTVEELSTLSRENVNSFDRAATYNWSTFAADLSDVLLLTSMLSPLLLFTSSAVRDDAGTYTIMYIQNFMWTYSVTHIAKVSITRYRPYVYNNEVPEEMRRIPDSKHSFFSGHTSYAFSFAVFLSSTFANYNPDSSLKPYIWGTFVLLAATTGYLRFAAGMHYPTDIIAGAIFGSAIGYLIPLIHEKEEDGSSIGPTKIQTNNLFAISIGF